MIKHLSYSNVMATLAVFLVLGGGAYAATKLPKNSVGSKQIKKNAVTANKIKGNSVNSSKVKNGSLLAGDFKAGQLPRGATGAQGVPGLAGAAGTAGIAGVAGTTGPAGSDGTTGATGATGMVGPAGPTAAGFTGGSTPEPLDGNGLTFDSFTLITDEVSDIMVWGSPQDQQITCPIVGGCVGNTVGLGLYIGSSSDPTQATPVPGSRRRLLGASNAPVLPPPATGLIRDVPAGAHTVFMSVYSTVGSVGFPANPGESAVISAIAVGSD